MICNTALKVLLAGALISVALSGCGGNNDTDNMTTTSAPNTTPATPDTSMDAG